MQRRVAFSAVALVAILASRGAAAEQETVSLPPDGDYSLMAVVDLDGGGGDVLGRDENGFEDKFSVGIDSGGALVVNGESAGTVDPFGTYQVTVDVSVTVLYTSYVTRVYDQAGNLIHQNEHYTSEAPTESLAVAGEVLSLTVQ